ncbi:MAG TPA: hypothetical protein VIU93_14680 [Gallionellaceae bacterium]
MRDDLSDKLVHLTKGVGEDPSKHREEALKALGKILKEKRLLGGTGFIKGSHKCVCFSEAPIGKLSHILAQNDGKAFKYQPYGIIVDKLWLFEKGGRPVIYGPDNDYNSLPDEMKYRHVRFWLSKEYSVDHTWEREWRIKADQLDITPDSVTIVVPDRRAKEAFMRTYEKDNWHYIVLSDLGVKIDAL